MKKICLVIAAVMLSVMVVSAQENESRSKKEIRKEAQAMEQSISAQEALEAIQERRFVLEIDKVTFRNGKSAFTSPRINFIILDGDNAIVQLSSTAAIYRAPNGISGITVEGTPTNVSITTDKRGNLNLSMSVQGTAISAQVNINMPKGSNRGIATVVPNFNPYRITLKGLIYPLEKSEVFKGTTSY